MRCLALACLLAGLGTASRGDIPLVGIDEDGHEVVTRVPKATYAKGVAQMLAAARDEALPALERLGKGKQWKVATVSLGIGLDLSIGLSPFFAVGIAPKFRAHLVSTPIPIIP